MDKLSPKWWLVLSLVLLSLSLFHVWLAWLVLVALVPLLHLTAKYDLKHEGQKKIVLWFWVYGLFYMLTALGWMLQVRPENWTALQGASGRINQVVVWLLSALVLSVGFLLVGYLVSFLKRRRLPETALLAVLTVALPLSEAVRGVGYSIASYGPGGSIGPYWNFGSFGLQAMSTPLAFAARFVGLYGLTMFVVAINVAIYLALTRRWKPALATIVPIFSLAFLGFLLYRQPGNDQKTVGFIHIETLAESVALDAINADGQRADLLVAPEYANLSIDEQQDRIDALIVPSGTFIMSSPDTSLSPPYVNVSAYSPARGIYDTQSKRFLIPTGEFMPYLISGYSNLVGQGEWIEIFNETRQIRRGDGSERPVTTPDGVVVGTLSCSGILAPEQFRQLASDGAEILASPASLRLLSGASLYQRQALEMARFHAIANAKPFIQASRGDQSFVLDHNGRELASIHRDTDLKTAKVAPMRARTLYTRFGELGLMVAALAVGTATVFSLQKPRR